MITKLSSYSYYGFLFSENIIEPTLGDKPKTSNLSEYSSILYCIKECQHLRTI